MAIVQAWLDLVPKGPYVLNKVYTLRGFKEGTAKADYDSDMSANAIIFASLSGVSPSDSKATSVLPNNIIIRNLGANDILFTFDGTNTHGRIKANTEREFKNRRELGVALKAVGGDSAYEVECW